MLRELQKGLKNNSQRKTFQEIRRLQNIYKTDFQWTPLPAPPKWVTYLSLTFSYKSCVFFHHCQKRLTASFLQSFRSYMSASQWYNLTWNSADKRLCECTCKVSPMLFREQIRGFDNSQNSTNINYCILNVDDLYTWEV